MNTIPMFSIPLGTTFISQSICDKIKPLKGITQNTAYDDAFDVLKNQKTKYVDNYQDLFSLLDQFVTNKRESIIISAGAGDISSQIRFFYDSRK